jgi:hypothetical protein
MNSKKTWKKTFGGWRQWMGWWTWAGIRRRTRAGGGAEPARWMARRRVARRCRRAAPERRLEAGGGNVVG